MDNSSQEPSRQDRRLRLDVVVSAGLLATVVVGNLAWHASDLHILTALGTR